MIYEDAEAGFHAFIEAVHTHNLDRVGEHCTGWQASKLLKIDAKRRLKKYSADFPKDLKVIKAEIVQEGAAMIHVEATHASGRTMVGKFDMTYEGDVWKVSKESWQN